MFTSRFRKLKCKNPLCYYLQCHSAEGRKIRSPGWWLLEPDRRAGPAVYLEKKYSSTSRGSDLVQPGALLRDKIWPDLSPLRSSSLCIPQHCCSVILLLLGTEFFPISNTSFLLASRSSSYDPIPRFGAWQEAIDLWVVFLHLSLCTFTPTYSYEPHVTFLKTVAVLCWERRQKNIFFFLHCSGSSSLQNEMLTSAFAFPSCCVLHWIRPEKQYHQAWSSIYQCSQDWFVTLPILGKWMSPSRSLPVQADLCFAHISHVM